MTLPFCARSAVAQGTTAERWYQEKNKQGYWFVPTAVGMNNTILGNSNIPVLCFLVKQPSLLGDFSGQQIRK